MDQRGFKSTQEPQNAPTRVIIKMLIAYEIIDVSGQPVH